MAARWERLYHAGARLLRSRWRGRRTEEVYVTKLDDASLFVGALFKDTFGDAIPKEPTHYVAFKRTRTRCFEAIGYYHVAFLGEYALVGGLCVDIRMRGRGVGALLERYVYRDAGDVNAYFAYVGDATRARRVGFVETEHPHLLVYWVVDVSLDERARLVDEVAALGPF